MSLRNVPFRIRVKLSRKRNEDEDAKEKLYTHVTHVQVNSFKGNAASSGRLFAQVFKLSMTSRHKLHSK
jgi:hypothetical protein